MRFCTGTFRPWGVGSRYMSAPRQGEPTNAKIKVFKVKYTYNKGPGNNLLDTTIDANIRIAGEYNMYTMNISYPYVNTNAFDDFLRNGLSS